MLDEDVCNNSVWAFRNFIIQRRPNPEFQPGSVELVNSELKILIENRLPQNFGNEAAWVYLRGLYCLSEAD